MDLPGDCGSVPDVITQEGAKRSASGRWDAQNSLQNARTGRGRTFGTRHATALSEGILIFLGCGPGSNWSRIATRRRRSPPSPRGFYAATKRQKEGSDESFKPTQRGISARPWRSGCAAMAAASRPRSGTNFFSRSSRPSPPRGHRARYVDQLGHCHPTARRHDRERQPGRRIY